MPIYPVGGTLHSANSTSFTSVLRVLGTLSITFLLRCVFRRDYYEANKWNTAAIHSSRSDKGQRAFMDRFHSKSEKLVWQNILLQPWKSRLSVYFEGRRSVFLENGLS